MSAEELPRIFIGSSTEALGVAYALQTSLEFDSEPTVWTQGIFKPSSFALKDLVAALQNFDFAVFVFNPDDVVTMRSHSMQAVRDNIIFELGLFMGRLGIDRCFILRPRGQSQLHLPSDLLGLQALEFTPNRSDSNTLAALGPAAHTLRGVFAKFRKMGKSKPVAASFTDDEKRRNLDRYLAIWNSTVMGGDRQRANDGIAINVMDDDTGHDTAVVNRIVAFLETVCDAASRGEIDSAVLNAQLGDTIRRVHQYAGHYFRNAANDGDIWTSQVILTWLQSHDSK